MAVESSELETYIERSYAATEQALHEERLRAHQR